MIIVAEDKAKFLRELEAVTFPCMADIQEGEIRTLKQNARYWSSVIPATQNHLCRQDGQMRDPTAIHEWLKVQRFGKKIDVINGIVIERCAKSRKMTTRQFSKFSEWAEAFVISELGVDPVEIDGLHSGGGL